MIKNISYILNPFFVAALMFLPQKSEARFAFGFMPILPLPISAPVLLWYGSNIGVATSWRETIVLTNTGNAMTGAITINLTGSGLNIYYLGTGDTCTGAFLMPGGTCSVEVQNQNTSGQIWLEATDGVLSTTVRVYDCPGC